MTSRRRSNSRTHIPKIIKDIGAGFLHLFNWCICTLLISAIPFIVCLHLCRIYGFDGHEMQLILETSTLLLGVFITSLADFFSSGIKKNGFYKCMFIFMVVFLVLYSVEYGRLYSDSFRGIAPTSDQLVIIKKELRLFGSAYLIIAALMQWIGGFADGRQ